MKLSSSYLIVLYIAILDEKKLLSTTTYNLITQKTILKVKNSSLLITDLAFVGLYDA